MNGDGCKAEHSTGQAGMSRSCFARRLAAAQRHELREFGGEAVKVCAADEGGVRAECQSSEDITARPDSSIHIQSWLDSLLRECRSTSGTSIYCTWPRTGAIASTTVTQPSILRARLG